jgi:serine/threonine protein kinase
MEYFRGADLRNLLNNSPLNWELRCRILKQVSATLHRLHSEKNIVHGDLHSGNILCDNWHVTLPGPAISDFGLAKLDHPRGSYGVIPYMAPELLRGQPHTRESDIYALGVIMWELASGEPPFNDRNHNASLMLNICDGKRPPIFEEMPEFWVHLMKQCWDGNPAKRPTAQEVMSTVAGSEFYKESMRGAFVKYTGEEAQPMESVSHPGSVYTSRFIPSFSTLETYAREKNLEIKHMSDDEWRSTVSHHLSDSSSYCVFSLFIGLHVLPPQLAEMTLEIDYHDDDNDNGWSLVQVDKKVPY